MKPVTDPTRGYLLWVEQLSGMLIAQLNISGQLVSTHSSFQQYLDSNRVFLQSSPLSHMYNKSNADYSTSCDRPV